MKPALALLAICSSVFAQTSSSAPAKPVVHHSAAATGTKSTSALPKVAGLPHTLYTLKYIDIKIGTGALPEPMRFYTVNYTGYLPDGTKFDSSVDPAFQHPTPFTFPYGGHRVITAWDTGLEGMRVGGKRRLFVPFQLGYGMMGHPPKIPAKTNLIFDVELLSYSDKPPAPPAPKPAPPAPATPPANTPPGAPAAPAAPASPAAPAPPSPPPAPSASPSPSATPAPGLPAAPPAAAPSKPATPPSR